MFRSPAVLANANSSIRKNHTLPVTVIEHGTGTTGIWFWKQEYYTVKVKLTPHCLNELRKIVQQECGESMDAPPSSLQEMEIRYHSLDERNKFNINDKAEMLFSTARPILQHFYRMSPFQWDGLRKNALA